MTALGNVDRRGGTDFIKFDWDFEGFRFRTFYNSSTQYVSSAYFDVSEDQVSATTLDFSLERSDSLDRGFLDGTILTYGVNARLNRVRSHYLLTDDEEQMLYAGFFQLEKDLFDDLTLTLGCRLDTRPEQSGVNVSPRLGLVYRPWEGHYLWGAYNQAFQNPSFMENFLSVDFTTSRVLPGLGVVPVDGFFAGNRDLDSEKQVSYEIGYRNASLENIHFSADVFINRTNDLVTYQSILDPSGLPGVLGVDYLYVNQGSSRSFGGTLAMEALLTDRLTGYANYSRLSVSGDVDWLSPANKASAGLLFDLGEGFFLNLNGNYVSSAEANAEEIGLLEDGRTDAYFLTNGYLRYDVPDTGLSLSLSGFNLLNDEHVEIPGGEEIGTLITFGMTYRF